MAETSRCYLSPSLYEIPGKCRKTVNVSSYGFVASADIGQLSFVGKQHPHSFIPTGCFRLLDGKVEEVGLEVTN